MYKEHVGMFVQWINHRTVKSNDQKMINSHRIYQIIYQTLETIIESSLRSEKKKKKV